MARSCGSDIKEILLSAMVTFNVIPYLLLVQFTVLLQIKLISRSKYFLTLRP